MSRGAVAAAGALGLTGVALGAFGAHAMREHLSREAMEIYRTATLYHIVHAAAALAVAVAADRLSRPRTIVTLFCAGVVVFSGSLYFLAATGVRWLGAVTPLGGLALLAGWLVVMLELLPPRSG